MKIQGCAKMKIGGSGERKAHPAKTKNPVREDRAKNPDQLQKTYSGLPQTSRGQQASREQDHACSTRWTVMDGTEATTLVEQFASASRTVSKKALLIDVARYQHLLDESGLSDTQKEEFLKSLWAIMISFVDLGFTVQPLEESCGKVGNDPADPENLSARAIGSMDYEKEI